MKAFGVILFMGVAITVQAQYKAPSQYFRKDFPAPNQTQPQQPQQGQQSGATSRPPAQVVQPKFKDVATNSQFFFLTDTNRAYPWTKISASVATNVKTGIRQTLHPELPVQR